MTKKQKRRNVYGKAGSELSRRGFLRGTMSGAAIVVGLPYFDYLFNSNGTALAQGANTPMRFGTWFWGLGWNSIGSNNDTFMPSGAGAQDNWSLPSGLAALTNVKDYLTVFTNYSYTNAEGALHIPSRGLSLSASHNPTFVRFDGADGYRRQDMPHPSIDALVHEAWGENLGTRHDYLNATMRVGNLYQAYHSWNRGGNFRNFQRTPRDFFDQVFAPISGNAPPPDDGVTGRFRKSVIDAVKPELDSFQQTLGTSDKLRLDAHMAGIRELERQIDDVQPVPQCSDVATPQNYGSANELRQRNEVMSDLLVYALSCNLTRLFCYEFTPTQCTGTIPELGITSNAHDNYSHAGNTQTMREYNEFVIENLGYFVDKLRNTPEGDGNLLDHMAVLATSEYGPLHYHDYHPYLLVGKAHGGLKGNYHSRLGNKNNNDAARVLLTAAHAVGANVSHVGMSAEEGVGVNYRRTDPVNEVLG